MLEYIVGFLLRAVSRAMTYCSDNSSFSRRWVSFYSSSLSHLRVRYMSLSS